jgi:hypothetical protein
MLSYVPVVGTLCAMRDYIACRRKGEPVEALLNGLALFPIAGGLPKTAEVFLFRMHQSTLAGKANGRLQHRRSRGGRYPFGVPGSVPAPRAAGHQELPAVGAGQLANRSLRARNGFGAISLLLAALVPLLVLLPGRLYLAGFAAPLLAVIAGHLGLWRARHASLASVHAGAARLGLALGYTYLVIVLAVAVIVLLSQGAHFRLGNS